MTHLEFLIPKRPVSLQAKRPSLQAWKAFVEAAAKKVWTGTMIQTGDLHLALIYLYDVAPPDTDNIIKPIQDALVGLVFSDDSLVSDVECHRRSLAGSFDLTQLPLLVAQGVTSGQECVYVRVTSSKPIEEYM